MSREILDRFDAHTADQITAIVRDAFVSGLHQSYWLPLALAVTGIIVALFLDDRKLANVEV